MYDRGGRKCPPAWCMFIKYGWRHVTTMGFGLKGSREPTCRCLSCRHLLAIQALQQGPQIVMRQPAACSLNLRNHSRASRISLCAPPGLRSPLFRGRSWGRRAVLHCIHLYIHPLRSSPKNTFQDLVTPQVFNGNSKPEHRPATLSLQQLANLRSARSAQAAASSWRACCAGPQHPARKPMCAQHPAARRTSGAAAGSCCKVGRPSPGPSGRQAVPWIGKQGRHQVRLGTQAAPTPSSSCN